jgi:hypothetical protein
MLTDPRETYLIALRRSDRGGTVPAISETPNAENTPNTREKRGFLR